MVSSAAANLRVPTSLSPARLEPSRPRIASGTNPLARRRRIPCPRPSIPVPDLRLTNTLSRQQETLVPAEQTSDGRPRLRFYSCGPTVYSYAHIGNFRTFLTADLVVRVAEALGWSVAYVSNITDVGHLTNDDVADADGEDKMAKALRSKEGEAFPTVYDLARHYATALEDDWKRLNLRQPWVRPRATEHVTEQIEAVERLIASGHAYATDEAVYFSVTSFPAYGRLSGNTLDTPLLEAVRDVVVDEGKRDPRDFALWKRDDAHLMQWYAPFGPDRDFKGFPGWHIECSVMARKYLGDTLDLHAGGEDLIFPHHECEIAQSEALTGKPFARMWMHTRFLMVEGEKMSKSKGNFYTVRDLVEPTEAAAALGFPRGVDPLALRYALLSGQYKKPLNFTRKALHDSAKAVERYRSAQALAEAAAQANAPGDDTLGAKLNDAYTRTLAALCDDLNTPAAFAAALDGVKAIEAARDGMNGAAAQAALDWLDRTNALLGVVVSDYALPSAAPAEPTGPPAEVLALVDERAAARAAKDFAASDRLRDALAALGWTVRDTPAGQELTPIA